MSTDLLSGRRSSSDEPGQAAPERSPLPEVLRSVAPAATARIPWNALANCAGKSWAALLNVVFVPVYVHFLGVEAYGLVGFYTTLQAALLVFDFGLSTTLNRELARSTVDGGLSAGMRDTVRTLETLYWTVACSIGLLVALLADPIARYWVNAEHLPAAAVQRAVLLMGLNVALQWPVALYTGGLLGLQRQVLSNALQVGLLGVRYGGAALVLVCIDSSIEAFFAWQIAAGLLHVVAFAVALWRVLPDADGRPAFRVELLCRLWRFTAGLSGATIATLVFMQLDKVLVSGWLALEDFGCYSVAWTAAGCLALFYQPVGAALFPVFAQKAALRDAPGIARLYHSGCQWVGVTVIPAATVAAVFAPEVLQAWLRAPDVVSRAWPVLAVLMPGALLGALTYLPITLQWAYGWTRLSAWSHAIAVLVLAPCLVLGIKHLGMLGAALAWGAVRLGMSWAILDRMHCRILVGQKWRWYRDSLLRPLLGSSLVVAGVRLLGGRPDTAAGCGALVALVWILATLAAALVTPVTARSLSLRLGRARRVPQDEQAWNSTQS